MQVSDAWYTLPNPYPEGQAVGAVKHTSTILNKATAQEVPLSEVRRAACTVQLTYQWILLASADVNECSSLFGQRCVDSSCQILAALNVSLQA